MRPTKYLLPWLSFAGLGLANVQQCEHSQQHSPEIDPAGLIRSDLVVKLMGMVYHSRCLWLQTKHATIATAEKTVDDIRLDLKIGSDTIRMHSAILEQTAPYEDALIYNELFKGFESWSASTGVFLQTLSHFAVLFREGGPHLGPALVESLKVFEESAAEFCDRVYEVVPNLALHVSLSTTRLMITFQLTIESFTGKPHIRGGASNAAQI